MSFSSVGIAALSAMLLVAVPSLAQTLPAAAAERRIALVSDPHVSVDAKDAAYIANFERVIDEVNAADVDIVLIAGDLTQHGGTPAFERFAAMAKRFEAPTRWVAGNHDVGNKSMPDKKSTTTARRVALYEQTLGPAFYVDEVVPGLRVVGVASTLLDSGLPGDADQWAMLERELAAGAASPTILLTHYPPFVVTADEPDEYFNINTAARRRLMALIEKGHVAAVFAGHLHRPVSNRIGDVPVIGAPAVSFGLPRGKQPIGWKQVTLASDGRVTAEDRYIIDANPATLPTRPATQPADGSLLIPADTAPATTAPAVPSPAVRFSH